MLVYARMKRAALVAALLTATSGIASAGTYLGLGIGPAPAMSDERLDVTPDGRTVRAVVGFRFGQFAVEGDIAGYGLRSAGVEKYDVRQVAVLGKYSLPIQDHFEAFGMLGLQHTSLSTSLGSNYDQSGNGFLLGAGIEYRLTLGGIGASVFVDYALSTTSLGTTTTDNRFTTRIWTLGATVSL